MGNSWTQIHGDDSTFIGLSDPFRYNVCCTPGTDLEQPPATEGHSRIFPLVQRSPMCFYCAGGALQHVASLSATPSSLPRCLLFLVLTRSSVQRVLLRAVFMPSDPEENPSPFRMSHASALDCPCCGVLLTVLPPCPVVAWPMVPPQIPNRLITFTLFSCGIFLSLMLVFHLFFI
jgi:hypothetical protein